jgi:DNA-directed RNA polymerase subunit H (RpoH/RPB5)
MTSVNRIQSIYKARRNILALSEYRGFDTSGYDEFSINEIDTIYKNSQLDMLIENEETKTKSFIKFYLDLKQLRPQNLDSIIEDLFLVDNILTNKDNLIIIVDDEPNDTITAKVKYLYDRSGIFVVIHNIQRLQYNILHHELVPKIDILDEIEVTAFKKRYSVQTNSQLPEISRFDPQALAIAMRPGDICKFTRDSPTALETAYYRVCV